MHQSNVSIRIRYSSFNHRTSDRVLPIVFAAIAACALKFKRVRCNPLDEWEAAEIVSSADAPEEEERRDVNIPLMGNPARRGVSSNVSGLRGPVKNRHFCDGRMVSSVVLERTCRMRESCNM